MTTETINEITANVPSTFEKHEYVPMGRKRRLTDWNVFFHFNGMEVNAAIVMSSKRAIYHKKMFNGFYEMHFGYDLCVNSVYVNDKRLDDEIPFKADGKIYGNTDSENREAIEKLKQKILEIAKLQPEWEENMILFNEEQ